MREAARRRRVHRSLLARHLLLIGGLAMLVGTGIEFAVACSVPDTRPFAVGIEVPIDDPIAEDGRLIR